MRGLLNDLRLAVRALRQTPVVFAAAVLTHAAGTGLAIGVFAVAYGVLLRPLPYAGADRLVSIGVHRQGTPDAGGGVRFEEIEEWRRRARAFERIAGHNTSNLTLRGTGDPRSVRATAVSAGFFEALRLQPAEGSTGDFDRGAAVLSAPLARQLGPQGAWRVRGLTIGAEDFRVAAVMPPAFTFPTDRTELWVRADAVPGVTLFGSRDQRRFQLIAVLGAGVSLEQARDDARRVLREIDAAATNAQPRDATVTPLAQRLRQGAHATVVPFVAGAVLVLLIACANVSGLLIGRAVSRQREFAVRRALGGGAVHVLRAALAESFTVAACGWALGLLLAYAVIRAFAALASGSFPDLQAARLDAVAIAASFALAVLVALLSGGAPAVRLLRADPNGVLKQTSERTGRGGVRVRSALVVGQIALSIVLLIAAGLLMRTVVRIVAAERGYQTDRAVALRLMLTQTVRFEATERAPFLNRLVADARALPGVTAAGVGSDVPPNPTQISLSIRIVRENWPEDLHLGYAAATPGYLEALGAQVVAGRLFDEQDRTASTPPVVVTQAAARAMFRDLDPIGREWPAPLPGPAGARVRPRVIGVVRDIKYGALDRPSPATLFAPWERLAPGNAHLIVRTAGRPEDVAPALRRLVQQLDPSLPLFAPQTLEEVVAGSIADRRLRLQLAATFAILALALAAVALWGAVAQSVLDRRHELAVRLALGATSAGAVRLMLRGGFALVALGVTAGAAGAAAAARALRHLLYGVTPVDPATFAAATAAAVTISLLACYLPARRAAAISPAELLRHT